MNTSGGNTSGPMRKQPRKSAGFFLTGAFLSMRSSIDIIAKANTYKPPNIAAATTAIAGKSPVFSIVTLVGAAARGDTQMCKADLAIALFE
jgi:hypothetical protein